MYFGKNFLENNFFGKNYLGNFYFGKNPLDIFTGCPDNQNQNEVDIPDIMKQTFNKID